MMRGIIGNVEFTNEGERLTLRYTPQFVRATVLILLLITLLAIALLIYPVREFSRGNWGALPPGLFLLTLGVVVAGAAIAGWVHLGLFARRPIVFDRGTGDCRIPSWFRRPLVLRLTEIDHVMVRRTRKDVEGITGSAYHHERTSILLVVKGPPERFQRLWGRLGLTAGAEPVAREIAVFIGRRLERRPAHFFSR